MSAVEAFLRTPARLPRPLAEFNRHGMSLPSAAHDFDLMDQYDARRFVLAEGRSEIFE